MTTANKLTIMRIALIPVFLVVLYLDIRNKRATFDYEILEEYVAGIVLVGTEIMGWVGKCTKTPVSPITEHAAGGRSSRKEWSSVSSP